jgi:TRAP-type C4-dicarboxylate transport system substrate-binding protein
MTPEDLEGVKLRMPGGEVWQFIGVALGASPTAVAFTEVYTALQMPSMGRTTPFLPTRP